jgi:hypothetical protein
MKTDPGLLRSSPRLTAVLIFSWVMALTIGCASKNNVARKAPYPSPHVVDGAEIMQRDAVHARTRELVQAGKYKTTAEARRAAEAEYPASVNSTENNEWADYQRWQQQQSVQSKFEVALDKMKRKS